MSFIKSVNELEHLAELIIDGLDNITDGNIYDALDGEKPINIAYKMAVTMQGAIHFPVKDDDRIYENIGKIKVQPLVSVASTLGKILLDNKGRKEFENEEDELAYTEARNLLSFKVGYWLLHLLVDDNRIIFEKGRQVKDSYKVVAKDKEYMDMLFYIANTKPLDVPIKSRPVYREPKPFNKLHHRIAGDMVRAINPKAREYFTKENCPEVFDAINRQMAIPYVVDMELLEIYKKCSDDALFTLEDKNLDEEQRTGILRELNSTLEVAEGTQGRKFWEYGFYDYRGRMYSSSVWLSHQGSKLSKSLYRFAKTSPMGESGWVYLLIHAANCAGFDKALMDDRFKWADSKLDEWMTWAKDPVKHRGWTKVDDPFCFLAAILEIKRAMAHPGGPYDYRSGLSVAWDATCSGLQVLSSLGKSVEEGEYCNITTKEDRGDYYNAIAEEVWSECVYTDDEEKRFKEVTKKIRHFNKKLYEAQTPKQRKEALDKRRNYLKSHAKELYELSRVFWGQPEIKKLKRKLCKRPCMTYFYSCRERTAAKQLKNDWAAEPGFEDLNSSFCFWLCVQIIKACEKKMPVSTELMELMIDMGLEDYRTQHEWCYKGKGTSKASIINKLNKEYDKVNHTLSRFDNYIDKYDIKPNKKFVKGGLDFSIIAPRTKFLLMQNYKSHKTERVTVPYKNKKLKLEVLVGRNNRLNYAKIKSATSPNFVHMLDAQIAAAITLDATYNVSCIHDSFGVIPANAGKLYEDIRTTFVHIFDKELLEELMKSKDYVYKFNYGKLNVADIIDNDYAFS